MATTTERGYGWPHQQQRQAWAPHVATGTINCWRCEQPIHPGDQWDLGHDDNNRNITRGPEHARQCNRATAGRHTAKRPTESHPGRRHQGTQPPTPGAS